MLLWYPLPFQGLFCVCVLPMRDDVTNVASYGLGAYTKWSLPFYHQRLTKHYTDVIMGAMAYQIISITIVYSTVYSGADQRKHQSPASLAFVRGIPRGPVGDKWPVTRKMFPFDDVIMARVGIKAWICHYDYYTHVKHWDVLTQPCLPSTAEHS